jgi:predicted ABC-type sugar transport system permease subunit
MSIPRRSSPPTIDYRTPPHRPAHARSHSPRRSHRPTASTGATKSGWWIVYVLLFARWPAGVAVLLTSPQLDEHPRRRLDDRDHSVAMTMVIVSGGIDLSIGIGRGV